MTLNINQLKTFKCQRKSTSCVLQYANNNRNQRRFNDVTIQSNDTSISANRMVLSCFCSFFDKLFATKTNDQVNDSIVDIPDVDGKSLKLLIQYIYTGQICINNDNVFDILSAANHLELDEVKEFCFEFLESCLTPDNCITILITAKAYKNFKLRDLVYKYISDNYEAITKTSAFLNLENEELFFIVFHLKTRFYVNDEILCLSLLSWTKQDERVRKRHFHHRLFKFVNVEQCSYCLVEKLLKESLICEIPEYAILLNRKLELLKTKRPKIISIGGVYSKSSVKIVYSLIDKIKNVYPDLPVPLCYHGSIRFGSFLYCIGGQINNKTSSEKMFRLNLNGHDLKWEELNGMSNKRSAPGVAVFNNSLVVCGGFDGKNVLLTSRTYNAELSQWISISSLNQFRCGNQSVTSAGCLYTIGGSNGKNCLSSVERLDGLDQFWKSVSSMQTARSAFAAVSCNDVIYAIGGCKSFTVLKSVEKYDCAADKWSYVSEMNIGRRGHSACVMLGKIFVVGGWNSEIFEEDILVKEIECYDPSINKWEIVGEISDELAGHSLVVV